jgi:hypothetical protein
MFSPEHALLATAAGSPLADDDDPLKEAEREELNDEFLALALVESEQQFRAEEERRALLRCNRLRQALSRHEWSDVFDIISRDANFTNEDVRALIPGLLLMKQEQPALFEVCARMLSRQAHTEVLREWATIGKPVQHKWHSMASKLHARGAPRVDLPARFTVQVERTKGLYYVLKEDELRRKREQQALAIIVPTVRHFLYKPGGVYFRLRAPVWAMLAAAQEEPETPTAISSCAAADVDIVEVQEQNSTEAPFVPNGVGSKRQRISSFELSLLP